MLQLDIFISGNVQYENGCYKSNHNTAFTELVLEYLWAYSVTLLSATCIHSFYNVNDQIKANVVFSLGLILTSDSDVNLTLCELTGTFGDQGATIRRDEVTGAVVVARIMRGGAADRSGEYFPLLLLLLSSFPLADRSLSAIRKQ